MNWIVLLALFVLNALFVLFGALGFQLLEDEHAMDKLDEISNFLDEFSDKYKDVDPDDLEKLLLLYSSASKYGRILSDTVVPRNDSTRVVELDSKWDYSRACLFTLTVVSTIGYGSMSPVTTEGRMFCVVFAIFGIPPFMALIAGCGENIRDFIAARTRHRSTSKHLRYFFMILVVLVCVFMFVVLPAILFHRIEKWSYSDSIYYTVISITTIGFGDLVTNGNKAMSAVELVVYRVFHIAWLLLGLAWLSTVISSRQAVVVKFFNKHAKRLAPWCAVKETPPGDTTAEINPPTNKRLSENDVLEVDRKQMTPL